MSEKPKIHNSIQSFSLVLKTCCLKNLDFLRTFHFLCVALKLTHPNKKLYPAVFVELLGCSFIAYNRRASLFTVIAIIIYSFRVMLLGF